jgi:hypothetical protein
MKINCAFCQNPATSGEHVWDDWLNKKLPKKLRFNARRIPSIDSPPIEFVQVGLREKIPSVCEACNTGWMSGLTGKMKDRFSSSILDGAPFSLDAKDAVLLAAFTLMKAIVQNYHFAQDEPFLRERPVSGSESLLPSRRVSRCGSQLTMDLLDTPFTALSTLLL